MLTRRLPEPTSARLTSLTSATQNFLSGREPLVVQVVSLVTEHQRRLHPTRTAPNVIDMISLGSRPPIALTIALLLGLGACTGDDGGDRGDTFSSMSGGDGDGDGDELEGDGNGDPTGDGDPSGDGDGDPTTGDGDGEPSGDGDGEPIPGECPSGDIITVSAVFYTPETEHPETVLDTCAGSTATDQGSTYHGFFAMVDAQVTIDLPSDVTVGQFDAGSAEIGISIDVEEYITDAWLGIYGNPVGSLEVTESDGNGGVAGVFDVTVNNGDHYIDAVVEFSATFQ